VAGGRSTVLELCVAQLAIPSPLFLQHGRARYRELPPTDGTAARALPRLWLRAWVFPRVPLQTEPSARLLGAGLLSGIGRCGEQATCAVPSVEGGQAARMPPGALPGPFIRRRDLH